MEDGIVRMVRWLGEQPEAHSSWDDPILNMLTEEFTLFAKARQLWSVESQ
jgi:hypothetical protein